MKSILLATDFSDRAQRALARAMAIAKSHGATLHIVHIVDGDLRPRIAEQHERAASGQLDEYAKEAEESGVKCMVSVRLGEPFVALSEGAREAGAELIIIGSHRRDPMRNAFVGTTAERMLRVTSTPALVVRSDNMQPYRCAVVAVDLAEDGASHISRLRKLRLAADDAIVPVFAYEAGQFHLMRRAGATLAELKAMFEKEKAGVMPAINAQISAAGLKPEKAVVKPILFNTPDTILEAAAEAQADLLVVGSRRKTAMKRFTLGSVSEGCLRRADMDVLVFPPEE